MSVSILDQLQQSRIPLQQVASSSKIYALQEIEKKLPVLIGPVNSDLNERSSLLKSLACERIEDLISKVCQPNRIRLKLQALHDARQKIEAFKQSIAFCKNDEWAAKFDAIPNDYRSLFYWTIWVKNGCPDEWDYGQREVQKNFKLLFTSDPLLFLKGDSFIDQMIGQIDQMIALKQQSQVVRSLESINDRLNKPLFDCHALIEEIETLPNELQSAIYSIVNPNPQQPHVPIIDWKKLNSPTHFSKLIPGTSSRLIKEMLSLEKIKLEKLRASAELEEFERISILYPAMNDAQKNALLSRTSPRVKKWIQEEELKEKRIESSVYLYKQRGAHVKGSNTVFCVYAPNARSMQLVLTSLGVEEHRIPMQKNADGTWIVTTDKAPSGRTYRYLVEEAQGDFVYRTDPFSFSTVDVGEWIESKVTESDKYQWGDAKWMEEREKSNPMKRPLSIYEMYVESWKRKEGKPLSFRELADDLVDYAKKMNFTHVELYGVLDNKGGWGFQVHNFFAPHYSQGGAEDFKFLVDKLHQNGIGVILDWIPAHYKHEPKESTLHNFDGTDLFSWWGKCDWSTKFFDFSKPETRRLLKASALYWLKEMHVDGLRIDAISHIVKRYGDEFSYGGIEDPAGIAFLKDLNKEISERFSGVLRIAEDAINFPKMTIPVDQGGMGFDLKWGMGEGMRHRWFLQTPLSERPDHQSKFTDYLNSVKENEKLILPHSHDEPANRDYLNAYPLKTDRTLYNIDTNTSLPEKFADMRNFFAWQNLAPSRGNLLHMGDEIGQRRSWDVAIWSEKGSIEWNLLDPKLEKDSAFHSGLQDWISDLNRLYRDNSAFWKTGEMGFRLCCDHPSNNILAYERCEKNGNGFIIIHNFSDNGWMNYDVPLGQSENLKKLQGVRKVLNSDDAKYGGSGKYLNQEVKLKVEGSNAWITVAIPPLSTIVLEKIN